MNMWAIRAMIGENVRWGIGTEEKDQITSDVQLLNLNLSLTSPSEQVPGFDLNIEPQEEYQCPTFFPLEDKEITASSSVQSQILDPYDVSPLHEHQQDKQLLMTQGLALGNTSTTWSPRQPSTEMSEYFFKLPQDLVPIRQTEKHDDNKLSMEDKKTERLPIKKIKVQAEKPSQEEITNNQEAGG